MALMRHNRIALANNLSDELRNLAEDTESSDPEFDKLLADIDTRIQEYRI